MEQRRRSPQDKSRASTSSRRDRSNDTCADSEKTQTTSQTTDPQQKSICECNSTFRARQSTATNQSEIGWGLERARTMRRVDRVRCQQRRNRILGRFYGRYCQENRKGRRRQRSRYEVARTRASESVSSVIATSVDFVF